MGKTPDDFSRGSLRRWGRFRTGQVQGAPFELSPALSIGSVKLCSKTDLVLGLGDRHVRLEAGDSSVSSSNSSSSSSSTTASRPPSFFLLRSLRALARLQQLGGCRLVPACPVKVQSNGAGSGTVTVDVVVDVEMMLVPGVSFTDYGLPVRELRELLR